MTAVTATQAKAVPKPRMSRAARRQALVFYAVVSPWILGFIAFTVIPVAISFFLSLTKWNVLQPPTFIGLDNYVKMFTRDPEFYQSLKVTTIFAVTSVPLRIIIALLLAMLLNEATVAVGIFRTAFYVPSIVASVAAAVLWSWILNPRFGPVNGLLGALGITGPKWLGDPDWALPGLILMSAWNVGGEMLIFLAGLKGIPKHLYEAAEVDGAGRLTRFRHITLPMLSSTIFFNLVMSVIGSFQTFDAAYVISTAHSGRIGSPLNSTLFYMLHLYDKGFNALEMGYASALAWILFILILAVTLFINSTSNRWVYYEGEKK